MAERITSTANPRIKALARLKTRKGRDAAKRFLIEGHRELERAAAAGVAIDELVFSPDLGGDREAGLVEQIGDGGVPVLEVGPDAFAKVSMRQHPDGLLAVAETRATELEDLELDDPALVLVLDGIEKPGNLGAIVRTADGAGVDAVLVTNPRVEPTNPNAIRASQGAVFSIPIAVAAAADVAAWAEAAGLHIIAVSPEADRSVWETDLTGPVALVIGSEAAGIGAELRAAAVPASLPMRGSADSLNASVAAGVVLYETLRQRSD